MNHEIIFAAIDIGTTKIVAIAGKRNSQGRLEILGMKKVDSTGVKRGVILNIDETAQNIRTVIDALEEELARNLKIQHVSVGIAGQHIKSANHSYSRYLNMDMEINDIDLNELLKVCYNTQYDASHEVLQVIIRGYSVDNESNVRKPKGMVGQHLTGHYHIVFANKASLMNASKCLSKSKLELNEYLLEPIASSKSTLSDAEMEAGVVLVDIGGGTTDVAVFYDGVLQQTAVIPLGGQLVTNDIREGCLVSQKQAESLKVKFGTAMGNMAEKDLVISIPVLGQGWEPREISAVTLSYIIQARMEEIVDYVVSAIESSGFSGKLAAGIVLTGGGANLPYLTHLVKYRTGYDARVGAPHLHLGGLIPEWTREMAYATSIGLLQLALESKKSVQLKEPKLFEVEPFTAAPAPAPVVKDKAVVGSNAIKKVKNTTGKWGSLFGNFMETIERNISDEEDRKM